MLSNRYFEISEYEKVLKFFTAGTGVVIKYIVVMTSENVKV